MVVLSSLIVDCLEVRARAPSGWLVVCTSFIKVRRFEIPDKVAAVGGAAGLLSCSELRFGTAPGSRMLESGIYPDPFQRFRLVAAYGESGEVSSLFAATNLKRWN